ncbi:class D beta-lactamase [Phyllobacterium sp. SYP-B3895]|uniref:class D beta-lactamase n=1 Tax=Phyllobacterium sp. SYP-B3895 TaxID=2663240 RepID=UPI001299ED0A|nr:class D beta-lactamase [Phyllobacterium sp. SYP-B3895]MRG57384.1 class D beta-lactamase [Phyllobacterium sp. SYP-B3895]
MQKLNLAGLALLALGFQTGVSQAKNICTIVANASNGKILVENGDCKSRVTPASTFKIALSVMGYDSGFLKDAHTPRLPFREGYPDWQGEDWRQPTDPTRWMKYSVVWYSQQITQALGVDRLRQYANAFGYGNADFSGDPGKNNALERAWISSSLKISPLEQVRFLEKIASQKLPVDPRAYEMTNRIVESSEVPGGWTISGKTGGAYPRKPDGAFDRSRGLGWYVGWARKGDDTLVFARLTRDESRQATSPGIRARAAFLKEWPALADDLKR